MRGKLVRLFLLLIVFVFWLGSSLPLARAGRVEDVGATTGGIGLMGPVAGPTLAYPLLFVTQLPIRPDFTTIGSTFGNHRATMQSVGRGGDLWIRYPDGTLKNLTAAAGYGSTDPTGFQGANAIAVRDPSVSWDGTKALFGMVIGAPTKQYDTSRLFRWQIYEISGLGQADTPVITRIVTQPAAFNNISPIYATDGRIIFTSDQPRTGETHLYPQLDEYELAPVVSGLWSLNPATGSLYLLNHAPSGDFTPFIDSFGRVLFTQWDHLQRDQEADADAMTPSGQPLPYGTFNYSDESASATFNLNDRAEVFPEPRSDRTDLLAGTNLAGHRFNHFFPWQINEDGTDSEVLNHLGRHELHAYIPASLTDDPNVEEYYGQVSRFNPNRIENLFQMAEDPRSPGTYYGIDAPEFATHASGQIVSISAPPAVDADHIAVTYVTHRETASYNEEGVPASPNHSGHYREPRPLADGTLMAVHAPETRAEGNGGSLTASRYAFRLTTLITGTNGYQVAGQLLTPGIAKTVSFWDPDQLVSYTGNLWELNPVEVRPRVVPPTAPPPLPGPEQQMFDQAGVDLAALQLFMRQNNLALLISRDVTTRDDFDFQQPLNLRVSGGGTQTIAKPGKIYDVAFMQFFQGDLLRGYTGGYSNTQPRPGRRVLAQAMHDGPALAANPVNPGPAGSVAVAADGSMAAFVPAQRAMTWQLTDAQGVGVVRERYWLTFQPGEVRVCTSCHGLSELDQAGDHAPVNPPQALLTLLKQVPGLVELTERVYLPSVQR